MTLVGRKAVVGHQDHVILCGGDEENPRDYELGFTWLERAGAVHCIGIAEQRTCGAYEMTHPLLRFGRAHLLPVLGPGADASHDNHVHLDMRKRRNDFRMCQWNLE